MTLSVSGGNRLITLIGLLNVILGILLILYVVGVVFLLLRRGSTLLYRVLVFISGLSIGINLVYSGLLTIGGALVGISVTTLTVPIAVSLVLHLIPITTLTIILIQFVGYYYKLEGDR